MLKAGDYAVVVDFSCCEGFEEGTYVEIVRESYNENGLYCYVCRSHSPESQWPNYSLLQCPDCLHPIKTIDACPEVHNEH